MTCVSMACGSCRQHPYFELSCYAKQMLVHEKAVVKITKDLPLEKAALLGCSVVTGVGAAQNTAKVRPGDTVAVVGCGGIGLDAIQGEGSSMGSTCFRIDMPTYANLDLQGRLKLDELVSRWIKLDEINAGFDALRSGSVARSAIRMGGVA